MKCSVAVTQKNGHLSAGINRHQIGLSVPVKISSLNSSDNPNNQRWRQFGEATLSIPQKDRNVRRIGVRYCQVWLAVRIEIARDHAGWPGANGPHRRTGRGGKV